MSTFFFPKHKYLLLLLFLLSIVACNTEQKKNGAVLYASHCASCHIAPAIDDLPKEIWETEILPNMAARMGIMETGYDPYKGMSFDEHFAAINSGVYPKKPTISKKDWALLRNYILDLAPTSLSLSSPSKVNTQLDLFQPSTVSFDSIKGSFGTFLAVDKKTAKILVGDISGAVVEYDATTEKTKNIGRFGNTVVAYSKFGTKEYISAIGNLNPSSIASGRILAIENEDETGIILPEVFHRPVHTLVHDLDKDGKEELIVSEFGDLTGQLSLVVLGENGKENKKLALLRQPGVIRILAKDMDADGRDDLIVLTSQGDESITILYQKENLSFQPEKVLKFSPVYGSSWFELIDYDGDGDDDLITVHGDNADKSYTLKPYHGLRIHLNDGTNHFKEHYFYPLYGATRVVARDFDNDKDIDFGIVATFPDYTRKTQQTFIYLENKNATDFEFDPKTFEGVNNGRWFLMDAGDIDKDGDEDIVLSSFTYVFNEIPKEVSEIWDTKNIDLLILENQSKK